MAEKRIKEIPQFFYNCFLTFLEFIHTYMSKKKYVYANVKIPIELVDDYEYDLRTEYMTIEFEPCEELPEIPPSNNADLIQKLFSMHNTPEVQEEVMRVFAKDLENKTPKQRQNRSFRVKRRKIRDYTRRNYDSIEKQLDDDILPTNEKDDHEFSSSTLDVD